MKKYEIEMIADAIAEVETALRADLTREIPLGDEVYTAEDVLDNDCWKEDFEQWDMLHADKYECDDDDESALCRRKQAFESWLAEMKSVYLG